MSELLQNQGTGAGGSNTNILGKRFEELTNNETRLLNNGFVKITINKSKYGFYLLKQFDGYDIIYVSQNGLKVYMQQFYGIELFRCPDEAYLIAFHDPDERPILKILEKKEQSVEGSVETKLWSGPALKHEYEIVLDDTMIVHYAFCVSAFLKNKFESITDKKYGTLKQILTEEKIPVFYGEDANYFDKLDEWINAF